jgi:hypothetical protein
VKKWEYTKTVHQLFVDFKKAYESVRMEVLYSILIEFGVHMKLLVFRMIKMCLNEIYSKTRIGNKSYGRDFKLFDLCSKFTAR